MSVKIQATLPFNKETPGAILYATSDRKATAISTLYVRKDHLKDAGHTGPWPNEIIVTVEVPER